MIFKENEFYMNSETSKQIEVQNHTPSSYVKIYPCPKDSVIIDVQPQPSDAPSTLENFSL